MSRQLGDAVFESLDDGLSKERLVQINDILNDVVAEGILNKDSRMLGDTLNEPKFLIA